MTFADMERAEGGFDKDVLAQSKLIYNWQPTDTCLPGCYHLEFKLLKMLSTSQTQNPNWSPSDTELHRDGEWPRDDDYGLHNFSYAPNLSGIVPSFMSTTVSNISGGLGCSAISGVEWVRRFPADKDGYLIHIVDTPTSEVLI